MNYEKDIIGRLLDTYERRGAFDKDASSLRVIQMDVSKIYPDYVNRYNHEIYHEINVAIEKLCAENLIIATHNNTGQYLKIKLNTEKVAECYKKLGRVSIPVQCEKIKKAISPYLISEIGFASGTFQESKSGPKSEPSSVFMNKLVCDWMELLNAHKKLPYEIKYDAHRAGEVLRVVQAILRLEGETYIRNFSTALFKDSKRFQKEFKSVVESILFDYTDEVLEKSRILEYYNLYENPTFVFIKGNAVIRFVTSRIDLSEMPDGMALSNASLENIQSIDVKADKVITIENLTTYHDAGDPDAVYIYLGGYHNRSKQQLLEKIYAGNFTTKYFHMGDLDVFGFLILENLKEKTHISFKPLFMDTETLERFFRAGLYKELTAYDKKVIEEKKNTKLAAYADVLNFMLEYNCKAEQESLKALELIEKERRVDLSIWG